MSCKICGAFNTPDDSACYDCAGPDLPFEIRLTTLEFHNLVAMERAGDGLFLLDDPDYVGADSAGQYVLGYSRSTVSGLLESYDDCYCSEGSKEFLGDYAENTLTQKLRAFLRELHNRC